MSYTYTMEYDTAEKNNNILKFVGKWMDLENIILSGQPGVGRPSVYVLLLLVNKLKSFLACDRVE